jgi:sec-independent protein translocase protein TatB
MFDIGFWEVFLLFIVGLVVVGPERLPTVARTAALWVNKARRMAAEVRDEVERELRVEELKRSISQQAPLDEMKQLAQRVNTINADLKAEALDVSRSLQGDVSKPPSPATGGNASALKSDAEAK